MPLWSAMLNPHGPNYAFWCEILGDDVREVPLQSPHSFIATLGEEGDVECYRLDLSKLSWEQRSRLVCTVANKFHVSQAVIEKDLNELGFPIRSADVIVSFDMRAFV